MPDLHLPRIYPITDTQISGLSHREQAERLIAGGAKLIQLRDKQANPRDFYDAAKETLKFARRHGVPVIINDRVDIALALGADGVHLGQDDMPPEQTRAILGKGAIIGFSTHSTEQAAAAAGLPIDYIAIGPIFPTRTRADPDVVVGLDGLRAVRAAVGDVPLVAIGGIDSDNVRSVFDAGADSAAMIAGLLSDHDTIESRMSELSSIFAA